MKRILAAAAVCVGLVLATAGTSTAAKPVKAAGSGGGSTEAPYWGHWTTQAVVFDATGGNNTLKVADAVTQWRKSGWNVVTTTDLSKANITVYAEIPTTSDAIGDAHLTVSGGVISGCTIRIAPVVAGLSFGEHSALHELGHCGGLPHSTSSRSVMYPSVSSNSAMTRPSSYDLRWMSKNFY